MISLWEELKCHIVNVKDPGRGIIVGMFTVYYPSKKISNTRGNFHAKMGTIKDRNGMDLTEAEDIKKRWQQYTEELCKKICMTQETMVL